MSLFIQHGDLKTIIKRNPVASTIVLINTIFLLITIVRGLIVGGSFEYIFDGYNLYAIGGLARSGIVVEKEYYRLITTMFIHGDLLHFLFNTIFGILIISAGLEKLLGSLKFFWIYFLTGLASSIFVVYLTPYLTVGASGAVFGVIGVFLYITLFKGNLLSYGDKRYIITLLFINIIFTFLDPRISVGGHFGGLMAGLLIGPIFLMNEKY